MNHFNRATLNISTLRDSDIRSVCKERIESLEYWLRRLIDDLLTQAYGDFFNHLDGAGNLLIRKKLREQVEGRQSNEPNRYPRRIDAILLEDAIDIICKEQLFAKHFRLPLAGAFPEGHVEARTFMTRLVAPRNNLAHANAISTRQAEQVICYTGDIIESLKTYYMDQGKDQDFNVPLILKVTDSFGNVYSRTQLMASGDGGSLLDLRSKREYYLRPGDTFRVEVEVDPSFSLSEYVVRWQSSKVVNPIPDGHIAVIPITNHQVGEMFDLHCHVISNRDWHRLSGCDDRLLFFFRVLPPLP